MNFSPNGGFDVFFFCLGILGEFPLLNGLKCQRIPFAREIFKPWSHYRWRSPMRNFSMMETSRYRFQMSDISKFTFFNGYLKRHATKSCIKGWWKVSISFTQIHSGTASTYRLPQLKLRSYTRFMSGFYDILSKRNPAIKEPRLQGHPVGWMQL